MADESDTEEKKKAVDYIENAIKQKNEFIQKTMSLFSERVKKEELVTAIRDTYFKSYTLRLKIAGKQIVAVKENQPPALNDTQ